MRYWSKIAIISYCHAFDALLAGSCQNISIPFGMEKLEWHGYLIMKKFDDTFSHFDRILACDRQTETDSLQQHSLSYA